MFKKHSLQVKMIRDPQDKIIEPMSISVKDVEQISDLAYNLMKDGAIILGGLYVATRGFKTICTIAEEIVKANLR